ncbi:MAG: DUF3793 family protein [Terrisporobacter sp.]
MATKCNYSCKNNINSSYIKWLLEVLGPVILGSKPCEILNISSKDLKREEKIREIKNFFNSCSRIKYEVIKIEDDSSRILFINEEALDAVLINKKCMNFLKFLGYPKNYEISTYTQILINKLKTKEFPHEIGIFLGYPLKDVVGFMGYGNYTLSKIKYWKVYGDTEISDKVYNEFLNHREKMRSILELNTLDIIKLVV